LAQALDSRNGERSLSDIAMLSIGAGMPNRFIEHEQHLVLRLNDKQLVNLAIEAEVGTAHFACKSILKDKYFRINPHLGAAFALTDKNRFFKSAEIIEKHDLTAAFHWIDKNWI
jgi:hypothetical protein